MAKDTNSESKHVDFNEMMDIFKKIVFVEQTEFFKRALFNAIRQSHDVIVGIDGKSYALNGMNEHGLQAQVQFIGTGKQQEIMIVFDAHLREKYVYQEIIYNLDKEYQMTKQRTLTCEEETDQLSYEIESVVITKSKTNESFIEATTQLRENTVNGKIEKITVNRSTLSVDNELTSEYVVEKQDGISDDYELGAQTETGLVGRQKEIIVEIGQRMHHGPKIHKRNKRKNHI